VLASLAAYLVLCRVETLLRFNRSIGIDCTRLEHLRDCIDQANLADRSLATHLADRRPVWHIDRKWFTNNDLQSTGLVELPSITGPTGLM
jgi:hypothetical protein